ncbi:MAG: hypothetical protein WBM13_10600 [Bacteroidia bacterium]
MASYTTVKTIANNWIKKGNSETNEFNKFICYWIAFNCFYNHRTNMNSDRAGINKLKVDRAILATYNSIVGLSTTELNALKSICPIWNLKNSSKNCTINNISNFSEVVDVIYQIRCNLFHGGKGETDTRDIQVITNATPVLVIITKILVQTYLP